MFLSDTDIKKAIKNGEIVIRPFQEKRLQPVSYDILLGNKFVVNDENNTQFVDPVKKVFAKTREINVKNGKEFVLHPGVSVLGASKEFFGSNHYLVQVGGKSSLARVGLMIHNTAGIINPGPFLNVTLELTNQNNVPIIIRPGMEIAQLTFSILSSPPSHTYAKNGRYAKDKWQHFIPAKTSAHKTKVKK